MQKNGPELFRDKIAIFGVDLIDRTDHTPEGIFQQFIDPFIALRYNDLCLFRFCSSPEDQ